MTKRSLLAALAVLVLAIPAQPHADDVPVETKLVDVMNTVFGKHEGFRANHAKGIVVEEQLHRDAGRREAEQGSAVQRPGDPGDRAFLRRDWPA